MWGGRWKFIAFQLGTWDHVTDLTGRGEALFDLHHDPGRDSPICVTEARVRPLRFRREVLERWRCGNLAYYQSPHLHMGHSHRDHRRERQEMIKRFRYSSTPFD